MQSCCFAVLNLFSFWSSCRCRRYLCTVPLDMTSKWLFLIFFYFSGSDQAYFKNNAVKTLQKGHSQDDIW